MIGRNEYYLFGLLFLSLHSDHAAMSATATPRTNSDFFIFILVLLFRIEFTIRI
jgi:hypothetical protein